MTRAHRPSWLSASASASVFASACPCRIRPVYFFASLFHCSQSARSSGKAEMLTLSKEKSSGK